jgi:hypothetical protein
VKTLQAWMCQPDAFVHAAPRFVRFWTVLLPEAARQQPVPRRHAQESFPVVLLCAHLLLLVHCPACAFGHGLSCMMRGRLCMAVAGLGMPSTSPTIDADHGRSPRSGMRTSLLHT